MDLKNSKRYFGAIEMICYLIVSTLVYFIAIQLFIHLFTIFELNSTITGLSIFISLVISFISYSEFTIDDYKRASRQLVIWVTLFIILFAFTNIELVRLLSGVTTEYTTIVLLMLGLLYNLSTISDKVRNFLFITKRMFNEEINDRTIILRKNYSKKESLAQFKSDFYSTRNYFKIANRKEKTKIILIVLGYLIFCYIVIKAILF